MIPRATYRLQFHAGFTFGKAGELVPYFDELGVSHLYASPVTVAVPGSQHGYDVIDPTRIDPELGGEDGLRQLVGALRKRGMGLIIDIVPNHMGIAGGHNSWWNDVLRRGPTSDYAYFFDIDWRQPILLPILGASLPEAVAAGDIAIGPSGEEPAITPYGEHRLPIRPQDHAGLPESGDAKGLAALLGRQHYRLGWWRQANDDLNWRRFFTISELAGLRVEDDGVFDKTHALYFRLWEGGLIDGVRIDHVDGLTDPAGYCRKLRARFDALPRGENAPPGPAYIVIEKILGPGETLPTDWGIDGTSGYDFMEQVSALLHDPAGGEPLQALWQDFTGRSLTFPQEELQARQDMLSWAFEGQLEACVEAFADLAQSAHETSGLTRGMLRRATTRLLWAFPVYRTYGTGSSAPDSDAAIRKSAHDAAARFTPPGEAGVLVRILSWLAGTGPGDADLAAEAVRRFQQLSAPVAAKAVEDTAFYRYGPLLSRLDVGFDAARMAGTVADFHQACTGRAEAFPHSMLATATHDHKRGEDVRARLAVLSTMPDTWRERAEAWDDAAGGPASGVVAEDRYTLYQMIFGAWPEGMRGDDENSLAAYARRLCAWQQKALREAKLRSSWEEPDEQYERTARRFVERILQPGRPDSVAAAVEAFVAETSGAALANSLVQTGLRYTIPGVPDCYQGCELADFTMVDPDNRRPVDFARRSRLLAQGPPSHPKLKLISELLQLRREAPELFASGSYEPLEVKGERADHVLAFQRRHGGSVLTCAFVLRCPPCLLGAERTVPPEAWWGDTRIVFHDDAHETLPARLFCDSPVKIGLAGEPAPDR